MKQIKLITKSSAQNGRLWRAVIVDSNKVVYMSNWYGKRSLALRTASHVMQQQSEEARVPGLRSLFNF